MAQRRENGIHQHSPGRNSYSAKWMERCAVPALVVTGRFQPGHRIFTGFGKACRNLADTAIDRSCRIKYSLMSDERKYEAPSSGEKLFNRAFGFLAGLGIAPSFIYLLEVRGRKSGKLYSTAVNLLEVDGKLFLVAPRGRTQWVRNAEAAGEVTLKRGSRRRFRLRPLDDSEKPQVLKAYLTNYKSAVQKFFPIPPDTPLEEFAKIAGGYPVFELMSA